MSYSDEAPGQGGEITSLGWLGNALVSLLSELKEVTTKRAYAKAAYSLIILDYTILLQTKSQTDIWISS